MRTPFSGVYEGRRVLVTGDTGFKGSWLGLWLSTMGAKVAGYSSYMPSDPCNYEVCKLRDRITHIKGDVRDESALERLFAEYKPEIVFHLAAQPIVRRSYDEPKLTFDTNIGGTLNVLECIRKQKDVKAAVIITSDKCYQNVEWMWGYRENDRLGGDDPYSASKAAAEILCNAYSKSYFTDEASTLIATARAGNVIGGGDWAADRIIPDCVRAFSADDTLRIRSAQSTRPWQHVLEPLSGYLSLGAKLFGGERQLNGESFNFGPSLEVDKTVEKLIDKFREIWGVGDYRVSAEGGQGKKECSLLRLNCDKAQRLLDWKPALGFNDTITMTAEWYKTYYNGNSDMYDYSVGQLEQYITRAQARGLEWSA